MTDACTILRASYASTNDAKELDQALEFAEEALNYLPAQHSNRPSVLYEVGQTLEARYKLTSSQLDLSRSINAYLEVSDSSTTKFVTRVGAARSAARLLGKCNRWSEARQCFEKVIAYMTNACPRWLVVSDRQYLLSTFYEIPADAAAVVLQSSPSADIIYKAIHYLELSRGVVLGSTIDYRSEARPLERASPETAKKWYKLCMELDAASQEKEKDERISRREQVSKWLKETIGYIRQIPGLSSFSSPLPLGSMMAYELRKASPELYEVYTTLHREIDAFPIQKEGGRETRRLRELSNELDDMLLAIRKLPGLEDFLLPLGRNGILQLADPGPIFLINSSSFVGRSDAIIIRRSGIEVLPLPLLHHVDIQRWMKEQQNLVQNWTLRNFAEKNKQMRDLLKWLWTVAVEPILHHLDLVANKPKQKPRVHWIGTGLLSMAPFHAAGDYDAGATANTMSHVVSSYVPTLRALYFGRQERSRESHVPQSNKRLLLVAMPQTPGAASLPAVSEEVSSIAGLSNSRTMVSRLDPATPTKVLEELPLANIVHFACHAISDPSNVGNSHLLLNSESSTATAKKLTVRQISAHRAPAAELAFLSACSAAENRATALADEAIHIANSFQLAGFRHVVGTLWQTRDQCCKEVANDFYRALLGTDARDDGPLLVAEALHAAVEKLRVQNLKKPLAWAPFIHIGA